MLRRGQQYCVEECLYTRGPGRWRASRAGRVAVRGVWGHVKGHSIQGAALRARATHQRKSR